MDKRGTNLPWEYIVGGIILAILLVFVLLGVFPNIRQIFSSIGSKAQDVSNETNVINQGKLDDSKELKKIYDEYLRTKDPKLLEQLKGTTYFEIIEIKRLEDKEFKEKLESVLPEVYKLNELDVLINFCNEIQIRFIKSLELFGGDINFLTEVEQCYGRVIINSKASDEERDLAYFKLGQVYQVRGEEGKAFDNYIKIKDITTPTTAIEQEIVYRISGFLTDYIEKKKSPITRITVSIDLGNNDKANFFGSIKMDQGFNVLRGVSESAKLPVSENDRFGSLLSGGSMKFTLIIGTPVVINAVCREDNVFFLSDGFLYTTELQKCKEYIKAVKLDLSNTGQAPKVSVQSSYNP